MSSGRRTRKARSPTPSVAPATGVNAVQAAPGARTHTRAADRPMITPDRLPVRPAQPLPHDKASIGANSNLWLDCYHLDDLHRDQTSVSLHYSAGYWRASHFPYCPKLTGQQVLSPGKRGCSLAARARRARVRRHPPERGSTSVQLRAPSREMSPQQVASSRRRHSHRTDIVPSPVSRCMTRQETQNIARLPTSSPLAALVLLHTSQDRCT